MKRILVIIALCSPLLMQAQSIEHILKSIEQNNKELKAQKHAADATKMENRTNNNLPDPTVSYSSFYSNGAEGGHGTEFVASQGFEIKTLRSKVLIFLLSILPATGRLLCRTKRWTSNNRLPAGIFC